MDFALSDEQQQIFTMARDFATERMAPFADTWEAEKRLPRDVLEDLAGLPEPPDQRGIRWAVGGKGVGLGERRSEEDRL